MQNFKERILREKQHPNIYMQKTQGPKISMSSPNIDQRFKSKTLMNKQNMQPNVQSSNAMGNLKPLTLNSFNSANITMRHSVEDLRACMSKQVGRGVSYKLLPQMGNRNQPKANMMSKSINFDKCQTERNLHAFSKKHMKTEEDQQALNDVPIIEDCQMIKSQYESSENSEEEATLNYSKTYQRTFDRQNPSKNILVYESLNYGDSKSRETVTSGPIAEKNFKKYQLSRDEERKMKNEIVKNIIMSSKAQMMKSCDFDSTNNIKCFSHPNKRAKYRLNNFLAEDEEDSFYCSKCAVNIAKQGIQIQQISALDRRMIMSRRTQRDCLLNSVEMIGQKAKRQQEFMSFQKRLDLLKNKISAKLDLFNEKSEEMTKLDKKIQLTISNYDQLIEILKQMKKDEAEKEDKTRRQKCRDINLKKIELSAILQSIKDTVFEINNEKTKMIALKNKDFSFMFDSFVNKITSYEEYLDNLEQTQLAKDVAMFDEIINEEDLDEETLIDMIFKQMYERLTEPKLQALINSPNHRALKTQPIKQAEMQSGGSSLFCLQLEPAVNEPKTRAFRTLFNKNAEEMAMEEQMRNLQMSQQSMSVNNSADIDRSLRTVKYFKEENFVPPFRNRQ